MHPIPTASGAWSRTLWRRRGSFFAALLAGVVFFLFWSEVGTWRDERDQEFFRSRVTAGLAAHRNALASALANRFALLEGLRAFIEVQLERGERLEDHYADFARRLYAVGNGVRNLAVSEGTTYRLVYPSEGNAQVLGYDLLADERQEVVADTRRAMAGRGLVVTGPTVLRQGGIGLVARGSLSRGGRFWGLVGIAFDIDPIVQEAGLLPPDPTLEIAVRRPGGALLFGSPAAFAGDPVIQHVQLPDGLWELAARPTGGWLAARGNRRSVWLLAGGGLALIPMALVFVLAWRQQVLQSAARDAERRVEEGTSALARTNQLLQNILRASPLPIIVFDDQGIVRAWNAAAERVFGWTAEEAIGRFNPTVEPAQVEEFTGLVRRIREGESLDGVHVRRRRKDGAPVDLRLFTAPVIEPSAGRPGVMGVMEDVTGQREIERALRLATVVVEHSPVVLVRWRAEPGWPVEYISENVRQFGYTRDEFLVGGLPWAQLILPEDLGRIQQQSRAVIQAGANRFTQEYRIRTKDGRVRSMEDRTTVVRAPDGTTTYEGIVLDVTDQRQLEAQYRHAQKMEAVGQLAGGIAHDFNNLLQVVTGYAALGLADLQPGQPLHAELTEIRRAADRATSLVRQLLTFSRRQKIEPRAVDLNATVRDLLNMLRRLIGEHIELVFDPGRGVTPVLADRGLLEQVLMNLCVNARDVMPDGGRISIATANVTVDHQFVEQRGWGRAGDYVLLSVADTGPGIPPDLRDRIFEPFFTTKEVGKGTGLGLAMAYGVVKQHNGMIEVASDETSGAAFRIYLPPAVAQEEPRQAASEGQPAPGGHETILLAEDEELVRSLAQRVLERAGYRVLVARDGEEAIAMVEARAGEIDLALLDLVMPKAGGREVGQRLKAIRPEVPLVFCSGYSRQTLDENWMPDEGSELILKPYEPKALLQRVHARLARAGGRA